MYKEIILKKTGVNTLMCIAIVCFQLFVFSSFAQNLSGTTGSLTWELNVSDSTLTIIGNDTMPDYGSGSVFDPIPIAPWREYNSFVATIVIGDKVKSIGNHAFVAFKNVTSVDIPNSVITIGSGAFSSCGITSIVIPDSVTTIKSGAFMCPLTSVIIGKSVTTIEGGAFGGSYTSLIIPKSLTTIGATAFGFSDTIICESNIPPTLLGPQFGAGYPEAPVYAMVSVYVPCGSITAYQMTAYWSWFPNFQVIGFPANSFPYPDDVTATQQYNLIEVSWESTNALSYEIYRNNVLLTTVNTTTHTDSSNLTHDVNYCYKIKAIYESCESGFSSEVCQKYNNDVNVSETLQETELRIYPNPTDGRLRITHNSGINPLVEVYDIVGVNVGAYSIRTTQDEVIIDISHLAAGLYFLKIDNKTFKVVKQ